MAGDRAPAFVPPAPQPRSPRGDQSPLSTSLARAALMGCNWAAGRGKGAVQGKKGSEWGAGPGWGFRWKRSAVRAKRDGLLPSFRRGTAEGPVLIRLHYPFHSSFKSTKYTFPLRCPPRRHRQKKSNFPQFAPNPSPLPPALRPLSELCSRTEGPRGLISGSPRDAATDGALHRSRSTWAL